MPTSTRFKRLPKQQGAGDANSRKKHMNKMMEKRGMCTCVVVVSFQVSGQKCHQRADFLGLTHLVWATSKNVKDRVKLSDKEYKVDRFHICFYLNNFNLSQNSSLSALCSSRQIAINFSKIIKI